MEKLNPYIKEVKILDNTKLILIFFDEEIRIFDIVNYLEGEVFKKLKDIEKFKRFTIDEIGGIHWQSGGSLSSDTLYLESIPYDMDGNKDGK